METRSRGYFGKTDLVEYVWLTGVCVVKGKVYLKLAFNHWLALELAGSRDQTVPPQRGGGGSLRSRPLKSLSFQRSGTIKRCCYP